MGEKDIGHVLNQECRPSESFCLAHVSYNEVCCLSMALKTCTGVVFDYGTDAKGVPSRLFFYIRSPRGYDNHSIYK